MGKADGNQERQPEIIAEYAESNMSCGETVQPLDDRGGLMKMKRWRKGSDLWEHCFGPS